MGEDHDFERWIEYLHRCFLGRVPEGNADIERTENGNFLAVIRAFCEFQGRGLYPDPWILNSLGKGFSEFLIANSSGKTHKDYKSLDACFSISRKTFRSMVCETEDYELAKRVFLFKWCFGIGHREIFIALRKDGNALNIKGKEAEEPERIYERTDYASFYESFAIIAESRGYNKEDTAEMLLSQMSEEARKYVLNKIRDKKRRRQK